MPIYEYHCFECDSRFEKRRSFDEADEPLRCPHCEGERVKRLLSMFAVSVSSGDGAPATGSWGGGCACGGACACSS